MVSGNRGGRRRTTYALIGGLVVVAGAAVTGYLLLMPRTIGSPQQTAASYLSAWQRGDYQQMASVSVGAPAGGLAAPLKQAVSQLGARDDRFTLGAVTSSGGTARAQFTATVTLASGHTWRYQGRLALTQWNERWRVDWHPSDIYPGLKAGERFALTAVWPPRAPILAADGTVLSSPQTQAKSDAHRERGRGDRQPGQAAGRAIRGRR